MSLTISSVTSSIVNTVCPTIWQESFWNFGSKDKGRAPIYSAFNIGYELHAKSKIFSSLPQGLHAWPLAIGTYAIYTGLKQFKVGAYIANKLHQVFQVVHLGFIYGDYASDKKLTASVRLITWTYGRIPENKLPKAVHTAAKGIFWSAVVVNIGVWMWRKPVWSAAIAVSIVGMGILYSKNTSSDQREKMWTSIVQGLKDAPLAQDAARFLERSWTKAKQLFSN